MSISIFLFSQINSQNYNFSDLYSEKIRFNPAFSGLTDNFEANITYSGNFYSNIYSAGISKYFDKYKSSLGFLVMNETSGKGALNNMSISAVYGFRIKFNRKSFLNAGFRFGYLQQSTDADKLVFASQINPFTGIVSSNTFEVFPVRKTFDFSAGVIYFSNKYRAGTGIEHIDKLLFYDRDIILKPEYSIFFGKIFSVKKSRASKYYLIMPEIIFKRQDNFNQIIYGVYGNYNIFLTRFFLKHNINFNTFETVFTAGFKFLRFRLTYSYGFVITKYISMPVSTNSVSFRYDFGKQKKINIENTIYCSKF